MFFILLSHCSQAAVNGVSAPHRSTVSPNLVPASPRYYLHAPIIGDLASQARHDSRPQSQS
ncbi:hypothetical protein CA601_11120 [Paraburkholderia hospita]|nr:hypothetical protein CA601_11120 [Paraburkholderia hospita]